MAFDAELMKASDLAEKTALEFLGLKAFPKPSPTIMYWDELAKAKPQPSPWEFQPGCQCSLCRPALRAPSPTSREEALAVLKIARAKIDRAWAKNTAYDSDTGGVCSMSAILCAIQGTDMPLPSGGVLENKVETIACMIPGIQSTGELIRFNDHTATRKQDVLAKFDAAIRRLEAHSLSFA
jgi:hypothetical protein